MYEEIAIRQQKIVDYTQKARYYKLKELPEHEAEIIVEDKAIVLCGSLLRGYSFARGLWRKRAEMDLGKIVRSESCEKGICIECEDRSFVITKACSESEKEWYFTFDVTYNETNDALFKTQYYLEGAIADFTYVSFKWIMRNMNLLPYPFDKKWSDYLARGANNRIFYTCSGHLYFSQAYQETEFDRLSEVDRDDTELFHSFRLREPLNGKHTFRFYWFFGTGGEEHAGRISNILWELDDSPVHTPQTDMEDMTNKLFELWKKSELCDFEQGDHYAAHYFSEFFGQFKNGSVRMLLAGI